jgi:hypothetical protein
MQAKLRDSLVTLLVAAVIALLFYRFGIVSPESVLPPVASTADKSPVEPPSVPDAVVLAPGGGEGSPWSGSGEEPPGFGSGAPGPADDIETGEEGADISKLGKDHLQQTRAIVVEGPPTASGQGAPAPDVQTAGLSVPTEVPVPASAAPTAEPGVVRYPALTTQRDQVTPDQTLWVEFAIAEMPVDDAGQVKAGPGAVSSAAGGVTLPPGKLDFTVSLTAKGFDVLEGGDRQDFYMGPTGDSDRVRFVLKPKAGLSVPRTETISASLWRRGAFVAEITRQVQVATGIMSADASGLPSAEGSRPVSFVAILVSSDGSASLVQPHR